jgi:condensin complex subunit 2
MDDPLEAVYDNNDYDDDGFDGFPDDDDISPSQATQSGTVADSQLFQGLEVAFDFGNSLVAQPKLTKSIKMNFARTAKKVDVKRLKDNIWKEITEINASLLAACMNNCE